MENLVTRKRWDRTSKSFDLMNSYGRDKRWEEPKRQFFSTMNGKILYLAAGTGLDFKFFPPFKNIIGIDISPKMLEKAAKKATAYSGSITLLERDVTDLDFPDDSFDQVFTSCTFCSFPNPIKGLKELKRVLKPDGVLRMFEHTSSRYFPFNLMLHLMTPVTRIIGTDMNRDTESNVRKAGFVIKEINNYFLDVVKSIYAVLPKPINE
ncbi:MAG: class I SAM-dependent methyltransferase [Desulfobacterales bacterium]